MSHLLLQRESVCKLLLCVSKGVSASFGGMGQCSLPLEALPFALLSPLLLAAALEPYGAADALVSTPAFSHLVCSVPSAGVPRAPEGCRTLKVMMMPRWEWRTGLPVQIARTCVCMCECLRV